jgi:hypothetical protein
MNAKLFSKTTTRVEKNGYSRLHAVMLAMALLLCVMPVSCGNSGKEKQPDFDLYLGVLQGNGKFIHQGKMNTLNEYHALLNSEGDEYQLITFAIHDMDGDSIPEVILEYTPMGDRLVLRYDKGKIYGYDIAYRGLYDIRTDGTFRWSNSADNSGIGKLKFTSEELVTINLCSLNEARYFVNNKKVTEEAFNSFSDEHDAKEEVEWYSFSNKTIVSDFTTAWNK